MSHRKTLTIKNVAQLLGKKGLISTAHYQLILAKGDSQSTRLQSHQQAGYSRRFRLGTDIPSPAEVISSFNLEIPSGSGRMLTEDIITEAIAETVGVPYVKIDPLKLDLDVVTAHIPRP